MKNRIPLLLVLTVLACYFGSQLDAQSISTIVKGRPAAMQDNGITGYQALGTPTIALTNAAQRIGTVPAGTVAVTIVASGALNYGPSTVLTSASGAFPTLADKGFVTIPIYPGTTQPEIYVCNNATGTTTAVARIIAHIQR